MLSCSSFECLGTNPIVFAGTWDKRKLMDPVNPRRAIGGKLEVRARLNSPLKGPDIVSKVETWYFLDTKNSLSQAIYQKLMSDSTLTPSILPPNSTSNFKPSISQSNLTSISTPSTLQSPSISPVTPIRPSPRALEFPSTSSHPSQLKGEEDSSMDALVAQFDR